MTLAQLQILKIVVELKSFTLAASQLGISQSAVSHAIKSLEKGLNVVLFHREQNQITLTAIGETMLPHIRTMLSLHDLLYQEAQASNGLKKGVVCIGSFGPTASSKILPNLLAEYRAQFPHIEIQVDEGDDASVAQWLLDQRIDIGFVTLPDERFETWPILQDQWVVILPHQHPLAQQANVALKDLTKYPLNLTGAGSGEKILQLFKDQKLSPNIKFRTLQLLSTLSLVERGEAVSIVAESAIPKGANIAIKPLLPKVERTVAIAVMNQTRLSLTSSQFLEMVRKRFALK